MKLKILTLGCKVNICESELLASQCKKAGFDVVHSGEADIIVINSCTVTKMSDTKTRKLINKSKREAKHLVVMGCYVDINGDADVDLSLKNEEKPEAVNRILSLVRPQGLHLEQTLSSERTRAFLKIQDGCNQYCAFCIIPYARGKIKSLPINDIIESIRSMDEQGYKEIVLTGIHISSYGREYLLTLSSLLKEIIKVQPSCRIRLGSLEPRIVDRDFLLLLREIQGFCPHFHLSLQSGSDKVLKDMGRQYTTQEYKNSVDLIREFFPLAGITTDIICGYPTESEEDFEKTLRFVQEIGFSDVHAFPYSRREGTRAAELKDLPMQLKRERNHRLLELAKEEKEKYLNQFVGREVEALFETGSALSREYNRVMTKEKYEPNTIRTVLIKGTKDGSLIDWEE